MLYEEREARIMQQLQLHSTVKTGSLSQQLHVSVDTVRRDLKSMEQKGLIKYIHGGACLPDSISPFLNFAGREIIHEDLKRAAAAKAVSMIRENAVIAMNAGTTNMILAQEMLRIDRGFTVISNNMAAINILMQSSRIRIIAIGGEIDSQERASFGSVCEQEFASYFPDIAFLAINAVSCEDGFTDFRFHQTGIMHLLAHSAGKVYAVMDSSKLGRRSRKKVLSREEVDAVIMDDGIPEDVRRQYEEQGIHIL